MHKDPSDYLKMTLNPCTRLFNCLLLAKRVNKLIPEIYSVPERVKELSETINVYGSAAFERIRVSQNDFRE